MDNLSKINIPVETTEQPNIEISNNIYEAPNINLNQKVNQNPIQQDHKKPSVKENIPRSKIKETQKLTDFFERKKAKELAIEKQKPGNNKLQVVGVILAPEQKQDDITRTNKNNRTNNDELNITATEIDKSQTELSNKLHRQTDKQKTNITKKKKRK